MRIVLSRFARLFVLIALVLSWTQMSSAQVFVRTPRGQVKAKANEILVKFAPNAPRSLNGLRSAHASIRAKAAPIHKKVGATELETFDFIGWQRVRLPAKLSIEEGIALYLAQPGVLAAEPIPVRQIEATPNDPKFTEQYSLNKIGAALAWDRTKGGADVVVAVIDDGVDYTHPDLAANMWKNPGETAGDGIDNDGNGIIDDVYGMDGSDGDGDPMPLTTTGADGTTFDHHGTHVAGIIGSVGNNGTGTTGVNWTVRIMALRGLGQNGFADSILRCLRYATAMKIRGINIRVSNNSYGGYGQASFSQAELDAFNAAGNAGILNVSSAGNNGQDNQLTFHTVSDYDAASIMGIASSDQNDKRSDFSNWGKVTIDLAAPGSSIWSTVPLAHDPSGYEQLDGTSMASPCVAGAAALVCAINPNLSVAQLKATLMNTVDRFSWWDGLTVTGGRLNVARAVAAAHTAGLAVVSNASPNGSVNVLRPPLQVDFSRPMNTASVQAAWSIAPAVNGTFSWSNNNQTVIFTPGSNLPAGSSYLATIHGAATSADGKGLDCNLNRVAEGAGKDDFTWNFRIAGLPSNDMFAAAQTLGGAAGFAPGHNIGATDETGEPLHHGGFSIFSAGKSVWYKWTPPVLGNASVLVEGDFNPTYRVYSGTSLTALTSITGSGTSGGTLKWRTVPGTTYYIAVDSLLYSPVGTITFPIETGNFKINWNLHASPVNDFYAGALSLAGQAGNTTGSTLGTYYEEGEDYGAGRDSSIWYKWTAPINGAVTFDTEGSIFDSALTAYTGASINATTRIAQDNDGGTDFLSKMPFTCAAGTTYYIRVGINGSGWYDPRGDFKLKWATVAAPSNDLFANSTVINGNAGSATGTNVGANVEPGEPTPSYSNGVASVWYSWTAPGNGAITFSTAGSAFDTVLSVHRGTAVNSLEHIVTNADDAALNGLTTSRVKFTAVAGNVYRIRIDNAAYITSEASVGYPLSHGTIKLGWTFSAAPANDLFSGATVLGTNAGQISGTTVGANIETGEPTPSYSNGGRSIWYKWTAAANGAVTFDTAGSKTTAGLNYDTVLSVHTGPSVNALVSIATNADDVQNAPTLWSRVRFTAVAGKEYFIRIDNGGYASGDSAQYYDAAHGTAVLKWNFVPAPANDLFPNSTVLGGAAGRVVGTTVGANVETGEPTPSYSNGGRSIWYSWTAPAGGSVTMDTAGSKNSANLDYDTVLSVYTGGGVGGLSYPVADNNDDGTLKTSRVTFTAQGGTTYRVRIDNGGYASGDSVQYYDAVHGTAVLTWSLNSAPVVAPNITGFTPATGVAGTNVTINGSGFAGATSVTFDGVPATITSNSGTVLVATAPAGVRTGRIGVTAPGGSALSATDFKVAPKITSFTPMSGAPGTKVIITGANFFGVSGVTFAGLAADFLVDSPTQISATMPFNAVTGRVAVVTSGGTATSAVDFRVTPRITGFSPASGPIGARITISGANFFGATSVKFNTTAASSPTITATSISVLVPAGATTGPISVTTPAGTATSASNFTIVQLPTIASFTPAIGKAGTRVTLSGTNFTGATGVTFNGVAGTTPTITATSISVTVPATATTGKIAVTTPSGTATSTANFVVDATAPTTTLVPANGTALKQLPASLTGTVGDNVGVANVATLTWRLRGNIAGGTKYWNAATQAWGTAVVSNATTPARPSTTSTWSSAGALPSGTTNLPDGTYQAYAIATDKAGNATTVTNIIYIDRLAPTASVSTPANGSTVSALPAAISGAVNDNRGAATLASVTWSLRRVIGGVTSYWKPSTQTWVAAVTNTVTTPTRPGGGSAWSSTGTLPAGSKLIAGSYIAAVTATDAAGNVFTAQSSFTVAAATYSISGRVKLGTAALPNVKIARTGTTATVLTNATGDYTLIGLPGGATYTVTPTLAGYTFAPVSLNVALTSANVAGKNFAATKIPAPTITGFSPASGPSGAAVTITGTNLSGATAVKFNGIAGVINSKTATSVVTTVPAAATTGKISVTTGGGTATSAGTFTVTTDDTTPPTVSISAPTAGAVATAATASGTAADAGSGVGQVYIELGRTDAGGNLTHLYDWATHTWTTDDTLSSLNGLATGTTNWSIALPPLPVGNFEVYAVSLDNATPFNQSEWVSRVFNTTSVSNNSFAKPYLLKGSSGVISGGNTGANKEAGEKAHAGNAGGKSIWYSWTPATSGTATFNTAGSSFDTTMGVYTGTTVGATTQVGANDDEVTGSIVTSKVVIAVIAGTNYRIAIDGYDGAAGDVVLTWSLAAGKSTAPAPAPVALSPVRLSSAATNASGAITLTFTGPLQMASAVNPSHYTVHVGDVACEVESVRLDAGATGVTLTLVEGSLTAGQTARVSWKLLDSQGRLFAGAAQQMTVR